MSGKPATMRPVFRTPGYQEGIFLFLNCTSVIKLYQFNHNHRNCRRGSGFFLPADTRPEAHPSRFPPAKKR
jgi:hypothetical protein